MKSKSLLKELARSLRHRDSVRLTEADEKEAVSGEDSLDAQVDKYLSSYESEAKNSKNEGLDIRLMARRFLREAEEDEKEEEEEDTESDEESDDEETEETPEEPKKLTAEDIDVSSFTSSVMRLIDNYDSLLEVTNTILRRASNHLAKNYEPDVVQSFKDELMETHGVEIGRTDAEAEDEIQTPKAAAAGPMGGGGG